MEQRGHQMAYQIWLARVNWITMERWQYKVDSKLATRLFDSGLSPEEAAEVLYNQFVADANRYAVDITQRHNIGLWR
jgi:hypothetical protein